jgi:hypothetical protein
MLIKMTNGVFPRCTCYTNLDQPHLFMRAHLPLSDPLLGLGTEHLDLIFLKEILA